MILVSDEVRNIDGSNFTYYSSDGINSKIEKESLFVIGFSVSCTRSNIRSIADEECKYAYLSNNRYYRIETLIRCSDYHSQQRNNAMPPIHVHDPYWANLNTNIYEETSPLSSVVASTQVNVPSGVGNDSVMVSLTDAQVSSLKGEIDKGVFDFFHSNYYVFNNPIENIKRLGLNTDICENFTNIPCIHLTINSTNSTSQPIAQSSISPSQTAEPAKKVLTHVQNCDSYGRNSVSSKYCFIDFFKSDRIDLRINDKFENFAIYSDPNNSVKFPNDEKVLKVRYNRGSRYRTDIAEINTISQSAFSEIIKSANIPLNGEFSRETNYLTHKLTDEGESNSIWQLVVNNNAKNVIAYLDYRKTLNIVFQVQVTGQWERLNDILEHIFKMDDFHEALNMEIDMEDIRRKSFVNSFRNMTMKKFTEAETKIGDLSEVKSNLIEKLNSTIVSIEQWNLLISQKDSIVSDIENKLNQSIIDIKQIPKVKDVEYGDNGELVVYTTMLDCVSDKTGDVYEIGEFEIHLNLNILNSGGGTDGNSYIKWFNQTHKIDGYSENMNAPHVYADGRACMGNASVPMVELLTSMELVAAIGFAISFVENANESDEAGKYLANWPLKSEIQEGTS